MGWGAKASAVAVGAALALGSAGVAGAAEYGRPSPWQLGMQGAASPVMRDIHSFHNLLMWIITAITVFVLALIVYVAFKFNERANPTPSKTAHNTPIEIAWTVVPVLILVLIAIPSFRLLREQLVTPPADMTVKVVGNAWYWGYEYPADQNGGFKFDSNLVEEKDLKPGQLRLLTVDNDMVVPVNKVVRVQVTASDVMHSFAMPSFGIKMDAIPGRLNETWFKAEREGTYHGQCSELCGQRHAYMPITIRVVSDADYATWLQEAKSKFASLEPAGAATRHAGAAAALR